MALAYEGGIRLDESTSIDLKADRTGDTWLTISASGERGSSQIILGPETDELRELAGAFMRCADAADEARQSFVSRNGNGRH